MEKKITLTKIKATFLEDHQTFSKMDPFLVFKVGQTQQRTETAHDAGKQPVFQQSITLNYFHHQFITIQAHEEDLTSNDLLGIGKIDIAMLDTNGALQIELTSQNKPEKIGTVTCEYSIQILAPQSIIMIKNISCLLHKSRAKLCFKIKNSSTGECQTTNFEEGMNLLWCHNGQNLTLKSQKQEQLVYGVYDGDSPIFQKSLLTKLLKVTSGQMKHYMCDKIYQLIGTLSFSFEAVNLFSTEESAENKKIQEQRFKKLLKVNLLGIKGALKSSGEDLYIKINAGPIFLKTKVIEDSEKDFSLKIDASFYVESPEQPIIFSAYDKDLICDDLLGVGSTNLFLGSGEKTVQLMTNSGESFGSILVNMIVEEVPCRSIELSQIKLNLVKSGDIVGETEPYLIAKIGRWSCRTDYLDGEKVTFNRTLLMKFSQEKTMSLEVWDEDVISDDCLYKAIVGIEDLNGEGQKTLSLQNNKSNQKSTITFKYQGMNIEKQEERSATDRKTSRSKAKQDAISNAKKTDRKEQNTERSIKKTEIEKSERKVQKTDRKNQRTERSVKNSERFENREQINNENDLADKQDIFQRENIRQSESNRQQISQSKTSCRFRIHGERKRNFGDKIFPIQSSATLQKSILVYSMPKAPRFRNGPSYQGQPSYYVDTCFKNTAGKGVGFGFGNKRQFPEWMQRNMKENPPPGAYFQHHQTMNSFVPRGPTFGIAHHYYDKVTIPKEPKIRKRQTQRLKPIRN